MNKDSSIYTRLENQYETLFSFLNDFKEYELKQRPTPNKWSIYEHLAHLARYQEIFDERIERILDEHEPKLPRYRAEDDPYFEEWFMYSSSEIMGNYVVQRQAIQELLTNLSSQQFMRKGIHPVFGAMSIHYWLEFFLLNEAHHLYSIFRIRQRMLAEKGTGD